MAKQKFEHFQGIDGTCLIRKSAGGRYCVRGPDDKIWRSCPAEWAEANLGCRAPRSIFGAGKGT
jgi:hypothetical protein